MIYVYLVVINIVAFLLFGADKRLAQSESRRIPEQTLISIAVLGGSIGAYVGMQVFHHKTKKPKFYIGVPLILAIQILCLVAF